MAAAPLSRTRSARIAANSARPLQPQASSGSPSASSNGAPSSNSGTSSLSLFFTNARLLDLDLLPDWPGISPQTFATTGATGQGQKKRVQCVEWALFQLFALWDPEETRNKLKPFFPPLDQVQSINLRAALLRALEQAKKTGALGRDAILRKTMLDECKGERLEEVLASFSAAVLKKLAADDMEAAGEYPFPAARLAFENRGYKEDKTDLVALTLAHRASLHRLLERKSAANARYQDFADLLSVKDRGVARRSEQLRADGGDASDEAEDRLEMRRTVRNNWAGNERWMETVLSGDAGASKEGLLATPFDRVWRRVQQGRLAELEESGSGLLEQLDTRVRVQRERLQRWDAFRRSTFGERPRPSPSKAKATDRRVKGIDLGFGEHENLQVGRLSPGKDGITRDPRMNDAYANLVHGLKDELDFLEGGGANPLGFLKTWNAERRNHVERTGSADAIEEPVSDLSELEDDEGASPPRAPVQSFQAKLQGARGTPVRPNLSHNDASKRADSSPTKQPADLEEGHQHPQSPARPPDPVMPSSHSSVHSPTRGNDPVFTPSAPQHEEPLSPTQDMANHILESMDGASPSPVKAPKPRHTLSLAERTRLSMARGHPAFQADDEPDLPLGPAAANAEEDAPDDNVQGDLAGRTRRSMAGFDKARQKAQLERRRSARRSKVPPRREGSYFPRVDEEAQDQSMLAEELGEDDMEAVFKSRPKIKASPIPSPTKEWDSEET